MESIGAEGTCPVTNTPLASDWGGDWDCDRDRDLVISEHHLFRQIICQHRCSNHLDYFITGFDFTLIDSLSSLRWMLLMLMANRLQIIYKGFVFLFAILIKSGRTRTAESRIVEPIIDIHRPKQKVRNEYRYLSV